MRPPIAMAVAGSDPSGGAGIQADLKTFSALGVYGAAAPAALTVQNTFGVTAVHALPAPFVAAQLQAVLADLPVDAIKLGMLGSAAVISAVAAVLRQVPHIPVVLDPVMVAKNGAVLLPSDALTALRSELIPQATLLTPNLPEAAVLLGQAEADLLPHCAANSDSDEAARALCQRLRDLGARAVILKGGHIDTSGPRSDDFFWDGSQLLRLSAARIATRNTHGTGCTYSAALAAFLARGLSLPEAARSARRYVQDAIAAAAGLQIGGGSGPLHHFFALWPSRNGPQSDAQAVAEKTHAG